MVFHRRLIAFCACWWSIFTGLMLGWMLWNGAIVGLCLASIALMVYDSFLRKMQEDEESQ